MTGLFSYPKRKLRKLINEGEYEEAIRFGNQLEQKFSNDPDFLFKSFSIEVIKYYLSIFEQVFVFGFNKQ